MRLFSALWPSEQAIAHLRRATQRVELPAGVRWVPAERWHLTLAFYGNDASLPERTGYLDERMAGLAAPVLRLAGAGTFPGVLWVGAQPVAPADREALRRLALAAGAGRKFRPHVTVARWRLDHPGAALTDQLAAYRGPTWTAGEVSLVHSTPGSKGPDYATVHRVRLAAW